MDWERIRIPLVLGPTLVIITVLFFGSLAFGFLQRRVTSRKSATPI